MRRLGMWAAGYDCAIVLIGHLNKKEGSKGLYRSLAALMLWQQHEASCRWSEIQRTLI